MNDRERAIILVRANALGDACFGAEAEIWLAASYQEKFDIRNCELVRRSKMTERFSWSEDWEEPEEQVKMRVFAVKTIWKPGTFDWLFSCIANDEDRAVWFDATAQTAIAPYDGGFDIFSILPNRIAGLEKTYRSWMSIDDGKL